MMFLSLLHLFFSGSIRNKPLGQTLLGTEQSASSNPKEQNQNNGTSANTNSAKMKKSGMKAGSKMIKRVYLFSSDPNSIEVLASEGDQALVR